MIRKVLIANRGEIALRVMRACREEGAASVAIYSAGEESARHVRYADESLMLPASEQLPYLNTNGIIAAAVETGADAIHPGYGFLAENAEFAERCAASGLNFIGPPPAAIAAMGDKVRARAVAERANVPVVPGSDGPVDVRSARAFGQQTGYPVALKAVAGGGGRGFKVAWSEDEVEAAWEQARSEGERYFGNGAVYAEKYIESPRHIEIQIFADQHGFVLGLGERDCSIQRRHQKLIEEAPSPALTADVRDSMNETSARLAREVGYVGAGTVEYLFSGGEYYFLEMNTRIQVEHPITEEVTGIDLVREQIRVASGQPLSFSEPPPINGHAIECRINAEDPARNFAPSPGVLRTFVAPAGFGVRIDTGFESGDEIDPRFDNLIAKLVVWGRDRSESLSRLDRALEDLDVSGVATTKELFRHILNRQDFRSGDYDTRYLERHDIQSALTPFEEISAEKDDGGTILVVVNDNEYRVKLPDDLRSASRSSQKRSPGRANQAHRAGPVSTDDSGELTSPIQGTVLSVDVAEGDQVQAGELICVVEAMKMENELVAPRDGAVSKLNVETGSTVRPGDVLAVIGA